MKRSAGYISLLLFTFIAQAESLYVEQVKDSSPDEKALEKAYEQIKEYKEVIVKENIFVPPFHQQKPASLTDKKELCNNCHLLSPHRENERKRSFLNMHSRYISCLTCHFRPQDVSLEYRWLNFNGPGNQHKAERIAPFYKGEAVPVFNDHEMMKKIAADWQDKFLLEKSKIKARLHVPLSEEGPDCLQCHDDEKNMLDLPALGFSEKETGKLQQHSIPRFFKRFSKEGQRLRMTDLLR